MNSDNRFLERLKNESLPVLVFDGATGTSFQSLELTYEDFGGMELEGCNEHLVISSPKLVKQVHRDFLEAGADIIETNTFGATPIVLSEYNLESKTYKINFQAAQLAREVINEFDSTIKPRYVAGSLGPTTKLPTLGHIDFDTMANGYYIQAKGLIEGGVDLLLIETCQDVLQVKSAISAIRACQQDLKSKIPIMVSITLETTGTMLLGTDIAAALTILEPLEIDILGLNCATGPEQMKEHIKYLSNHSPFYISCIPNAGLPENIGGKAHYRLTPIELKLQLSNLVQDLGVRLIGGCCGTTPEHISQLSKIAQEVNNYQSHLTREDTPRVFVPSAASIYSSTPYYQDSSFLIVGERLNASGSKKVRELLVKEDWDALVSLAKAQISENAHVLDVNVDYVGRNGEEDMKLLVSRLVTNVNLPLMLDSTEHSKMEAGLKVSGGKSILNSTNFEDGEKRFTNVVQLAKDHGAGIVIGTIDEEGMARTSEKKLSIALRAYKQATELGVSGHEIFYDPLALPISTGIEEDRCNAKETIEAIRKIRRELPQVHIILGVSNVSFGLSPASRIVLNSVFLHECYKSGLDSAIISPSKILPLSKISEEQLNVCLDLIHDNRSFEGQVCTYDPLTKLTSLFEGISSKQARDTKQIIDSLPIEDRLKQHIIDGEKIGLDSLLADAMKTYSPLEIINKYLLEGMKTVGELFGAGQMQLPFVLQSAETMKTAVSFLEPYMEKLEGQNTSKGTFLIATVKGDVHDIGKNLVDIIMTNNGYDVINLGIKQDVNMIIDACKTHSPDCVAMSGLLVKSTAFMKDNLEEFNKNKIDIPVILGGAALTPKFVNGDCNSIYKGIVVYGKDAFTDLRFMDSYMSAKSSGKWNNTKGFLEGNPKGIYIGQNKEEKAPLKNQNVAITNDQKSKEKNIDNDLLTKDNIERSQSVQEEESIVPPFIGNKIITSNQIPIDELSKYLDKKALFSSQWQLKKIRDQSKEEYADFICRKAEPILRDLIVQSKAENLLQPAVSYGYYPCGRKGNNLVVFSPENTSEILCQFTLPRQKSGSRYCIADFFRDVDKDKPTDYLPIQAVTMGQAASRYSQELFSKNRYTDYLYFHGFAVQMAEALAEMIHARIRQENGFEREGQLDIKDILSLKYRGCRYSFGYPACPEVSESRKQITILKTHLIDLTMDESDQFHPEQSTTALVALHSQAKYFGI